MPFTHEQLRPFVEQRWITAQRHQDLPLTIYNYSKSCQYERHWTPETMACRGLVFDDDNRIVMRPFPKFFNAGEHDDASMPTGPFTVYEKYDGSLFLATKYGDRLVIATRGSFLSIQARWGWELFYPFSWAAEEGWTLCFELIHPENRIVVDYGASRKLVHLASIENETGYELPGGQQPFESARSYTIAEMDAILADPVQQQNREGFVLHFHESNQRVKVKFDEYVRLHRIVTGINARHIWERLSTGQPLDDILEHVPDEFYGWVKATAAKLSAEFTNWECYYQGCFQLAKSRMRVTDRKAFADIVAICHQEANEVDPAVMFRLYDGKPIDALIWKKLRPAAARPFIEEEAA